MDHDHGHWFVVGVLLSGALLGGFYALRAFAFGVSQGALNVSPELFLVGMVAIGALCVGKWWFDNRD